MVRVDKPAITALMADVTPLPQQELEASLMYLGDEMHHVDAGRDPTGIRLDAPEHRAGTSWRRCRPITAA